MGTASATMARDWFKAVTIRALFCLLVCGPDPLVPTPFLFLGWAVPEQMARTSECCRDGSVVTLQLPGMSASELSPHSHSRGPGGRAPRGGLPPGVVDQVREWEHCLQRLAA